MVTEIKVFSLIDRLRIMPGKSKYQVTEKG